ncbi:D-alanyl-D-alanine carboxypeptidase/D-alanyl-D-alanine-endopeptidase [Legionella israelensis]|uniref:D-alanyl-D-alanine carboxypeptidase n=1 Tax=Legionella israelensis TaxID=454 RepID=A0A0W0WQD3_9GAMM|nr:D-alanyl-D-alanine carboxypeptidase/D-alanyl-D-alanine-endopeptidase [Legionella israelensis]KTD34545.1 D-alanyl-D-alanine carboxypeptidase [Legionella israelensis]QBS09224.1 D-alanyl-D-alanine carboxypeptidase/D-alanyl-D-alanine-endopeptidase [Legionella israelensis]SCX98770.1 D-alanyl-D-alanine carboxypeptidase / D-alanyl-D-alanine-endopeptidase (penicillin-binding protein 4) [Legionella israelensis DSM 19235]STX58968.1 D-alanyl-D-alanine carboxypeptidase [Legionella israelensis]
MKRSLSVIACFLWSTVSVANIQTGMDKLINEVDPGINIGIEVIDLTTGESLYARNPDRAFTPASNMKIFSDAAALMLLGPDYRFNNQLSTNGTGLRNGTLKGNVYLYLPGDPSFTHEHLKSLLSSLKKWNIKSIQGDFVIDSAYNHVNPYAPGWMIEDLVYSYGAPLSPVIMNNNRLTVTVNPAEKAGKPALIEVTDPSGTIIIENKVRTKANLKGCGVDFSTDKNNHLSVRGCIGVGQWAIQQRMAIRNPLSYMQGFIQKELADQRIHLKGKILMGKAPKDTLLLASSSSSSLSQLLNDTLKPSDNLYAESLFLHTAFKLKGSVANWGEAKLLIKEFLQKQTGIDLKTAVLTDGSGLSRYDLLTPRQTVRLLRFLHERFHFSYEFIAALPVSGRDGTLQRRFNKSSQQDLLRAKTGTMRGVISLSGYLYTANGHTLAFAIYINNLPGTSLSISGRYRYLVDALCNYLLQQKPATHRWAKVVLPHGRMRFQNNTTQAALSRKKQAQWRRLETMVKKALKGEVVAIRFRNKELVLEDYQKNASKVWTVLQRLRKKYPFTVALKSSDLPALTPGKPMLLWIQSAKKDSKVQRIWIIKEILT